MTRWVVVKNLSSEGRTVVRARWCQSAFCRMRGLMFRRNLVPGEGLLLVGKREDRTESGIHMFWVFFQLGVLWIDDDLKVVDRQLARPWRIYVPAAPARYILEGRPDLLEAVSIGDELLLEEEREP